jgi:hypothetical protein
MKLENLKSVQVRQAEEGISCWLFSGLSIAALCEEVSRASGKRRGLMVRCGGGFGFRL